MKGVSDLLTHLARCCNPVPGDAVVGFITRGRGVTVHRADCPSILRAEERERIVDVDWGEMQQQVFPVAIRIEAWDRLARDLDRDKLKAMTETRPIADAVALGSEVLAGKVRGRIVLELP